MNKPFDVSVEQLAHDLALLNTQKKLEKKDSCTIGEVYDTYVHDYAMYKKLVEDKVSGSIPTPQR